MLVLAFVSCLHAPPSHPEVSAQVIARARSGTEPSPADHLSAYLTTCGQPWSAHAFSPCKRTRDGWVCWGTYAPPEPPVRIHEGPRSWWATSGVWGVDGSKDAATLPELWAALSACDAPCAAGWCLAAGAW